jgi:nitrite reductase (NO-forming)
MWAKRVVGTRNKVAFVALLLVASVLFSVLPGSLVAADTGQAAYAPNRSLSPTDIPSAPSPASKVVITLITEEKLGQLANGVTYDFWTYNGTVPGPLIRLRVGQVVEMHIINPPTAL